MSGETDDDGTKKQEGKAGMKLVVFPSRNKLLQPTAETLGEELNDRVKAWLRNEKKKKQTENILDNLKLVQNEVGGVDDKEPIAVQQLNLFSKNG